MTDAPPNKYNVKLATVTDQVDWVKTKARLIDLEQELHLAKAIDIVMKYYREKYFFAGVSSNNIFWKLTKSPIRAMLIPTDKKYLTLINPEVIKMAGATVRSVEGCGSIPDATYVVERKPYIEISGYTLEKEYIELKFGSEKYVPDDEPVIASFYHKEWIVQHEMDHLDGITIQDKGKVFNLNKLMT